MSEGREKYRVLEDARTALGTMYAQLDAIIERQQRIEEGLDRATNRLELAMEEVGLSGLADRLETDAAKVGDLYIEIHHAVEERIELEKELEAAYDSVRLEIADDESIDWTDPRTGKSNAAYRDAKMAGLLENHEVIELAEHEYARQRARVADYEARLDAAKARFSASRYKARMMSALLVFLSGPQESLGPIRTAQPSGPSPAENRAELLEAGVKQRSAEADIEALFGPEEV